MKGMVLQVIGLVMILAFGYMQFPQEEPKGVRINRLANNAGKRVAICIGINIYEDSEDITGDIENLYKDGMGFLLRSLDKLQKGRGFNTLGILEISKVALEEVLQNALVHRSYFKNAPVRLLIFDNRVEIISPGQLPNGLTVENIKYGNTVARNHIMASFAGKVIPYRGLGTGIQRAVKEQPGIEFINDSDGEQFIVKIPRPKKEK